MVSGRTKANRPPPHCDPPTLHAGQVGQLSNPKNELIDRRNRKAPSVLFLSRQSSREKCSNRREHDRRRERCSQRSQRTRLPHRALPFLGQSLSMHAQQGVVRAPTSGHARLTACPRGSSQLSRTTAAM